MRALPHPNIYYLYLIKLSKWFMLIMPIVALFYHDNGLDEYDIYLLQAVYSFSVACMEIPSGYMADVIGRRTSLVVGALLGTIGFFIYSWEVSGSSWSLRLFSESGAAAFPAPTLLFSTIAWLKPGMNIDICSMKAGSPLSATSQRRPQQSVAASLRPSSGIAPFTQDRH